MKYENGTFGSFTEYKSLVMICDRMNLMDEKQSAYISRFIHNYNQEMMGILLIRNLHTFNFVLECIRKEYLKRLKSMEEKYDPYFVSHLRNFVISKIRKWETAMKALSRIKNE